MLIVLGTITIVLLSIGLGVAIDRKVGLLPRPGAARKQLPAHGPGEAPASAIRAHTDELARIRRSQRCRACRAGLDLGTEDRVTYDGRELIVLAFACRRCAARTRVYVDLHV